MTGGSGESLGRQSVLLRLRLRRCCRTGWTRDGLSVHQALSIRIRVCDQACSTEAPAFQRGDGKTTIPSPSVSSVDVDG